MKIKFYPKGIPQELKGLKQWICYDQEGDKKIPYIAGCEEGNKARTNDTETFRTYEEALADVEAGYRDYIAFVLTPEDPYIFIDLDECHELEDIERTKLVRQVFNSYTEYSVSGKGMHIIAKGKLEGRGLHTNHLGLFDRYRGCIMTGHVWDGRKKIYHANKKHLRSLQDKVRTSDSKGYDFDLEETEWDSQPWAVRSLASKIYGDKFHALLDGRWDSLGCYPSQSEADHALINMFCDISDSNSLVRYLFAESGLYRDWKSRKDPDTGEYSVKGYLDYSIKSNRAKQEQRDFMKVKVQEDVKRQSDARQAAKEAAVEVEVEEDEIDYSDIDDGEDTVRSNSNKGGFDYPTGIIDKLPAKLHTKLARWLYETNHIPNQEIAVLGAHAVVTWIVQRAYMTPTRTGLNLNWWLVADTGRGKEGFIKAIGKVIAALVKELPHLGATHVGKFASGEAIETVLSTHPRFMSQVAEAGAFWRKIISPNRPPHIDALAEGMLNLVMASSDGAYWQSRKKAKKDEDVKDHIFRATGSFYGESTPEDLFKDFDFNSVGTGLIQRQIFFSIEEAEYVEENHHPKPKMPSDLANMLAELISVCDQLDITNETLVVQETEQAYKMIKAFSDKHRRYTYKKERNKLRADFMTRAGLKVYRLASQLAIGDDMHDPVIRPKHAQYAIDFISKCDEYMLEKFISGDIGNGQLKQESDIMKIIHQLTDATPDKRRKSYQMTQLCADDVSIVPYSMIRNKAKTRTSFSSDRFGAITAIDRCIDSLCKAGTLIRLTRVESETEYETTAGLLRYTAL